MSTDSESSQPSQQTNPQENITIPKKQYETLLKSNQNGLMIVFDLMEKFDDILDKLAEFESFVRMQKTMAKNVIKNTASTSQSQSQSQS